MSELHKFLFDGLPVRGLLVRLTGDWREVLERRESAQDAFPAPVRELLGEMAAAGVLMQSNIKFDGAVVMQIHGEGPVKLTVAEVKSDLTFRVTAKVTGEMPAVPRLDTLVNVNGKGRCAITLDPRQKLPGQQPYQGVVALHGDQGEPLHKLSEVLEHYMLQSEQLDTKLVLAANDKVAAGLLIQRLPVEGAGNIGARNEDDIGRDEDYRRISMLAATLTSEELLTLDADTILRRLFWEEKVVRYEPLHPQFACSCSRERVGNMLKSLGREEIDGIVAEQGRVEIGCDFCGVKYHFDVVDVGELFTPQGRQQPGTTTLN
ncbi:Hsp33 family molecular chaperone HslO [Piscinibacter sp. HJYY11]|uniref:Hsp33 family molecular chaperone HslO n=1 Tax=Piscinibacter sp. HJYY11 TaxID=2801333 RepID=UPI00191D3C7B|nr:Hsp33 family molecular chaperone HslO [Piscinibacter sp. HJYY11]MBL0730951.1 Hsp33 family molecular chaperone HslO [Piscinibacter sp. HJYY11]